MPNAIKAFANAAERAEIRHIAKVLEDNQLPDERPLFSAGNENDLAAADLDAAGLSKGFDALRSQSTESGGQAGSAARALLVSPADEIDALRLVETLPQGRRPHVIALPFSGSSTWYLIADPEQSAALARLRMIGSAPSAISVAGLSPARWTDASGEIQSTPGLCVDLVHTVAIAPVSSVGVVRCVKP